MTTYATMRTRISDELVNEDISTAQINSAIQTAIKHYEREAFWFNTKVGTFSTVADQELYTSSDLSDIPDIIRIDSMRSHSGTGAKTMLRSVSNATIEDVQDGTVKSEPEQYSRYADKIRLYPIPNAVYTITASYVYKLTALSADGDTNAWVDECEELIRQAAKRILATDIFYAPEIASTAENAELRAYGRIRKENRERSPQKELRVNWPFNRRYFDANYNGA